MSAGLLLLALGAEATLRCWTPERIRFEIRERGEGGGGTLLTLDEELGHRPVLGGPEYGPHGARWNEYGLAKTPGRRRLLFIGDSVTGRGAIVAGLRAELGDDRYEYWNAGVGGYSTRQELAYYRRYCGEIQADHVILTFHLNDFVVTPVAFQGEGGVVSTGGRSVRRPNSWLWQHSYAYRLLFQWTAGRSEPRSVAESAREIRASLAELRDLVRARGADFTVLVFPWLRPPAEWPASLPAKHALILEELERLGVRHYSLQEELERALAEGVEVQEKARDPQHPSREFGRLVAGSLMARGFVP